MMIFLYALSVVQSSVISTKRLSHKYYTCAFWSELIDMTYDTSPLKPAAKGTNLKVKVVAHQPFADLYKQRASTSRGNCQCCDNFGTIVLNNDCVSI